MTVLVVNPNSSHSVTVSIKKLLAPLNAHSDASVEYFTGPASAPAEITDRDTMRASASACYAEIVAKIESSTTSHYSAILICCFSKHPLVPQLQQKFPNIYVTGIFESSLVYAVSKFPSKFLIFTSSESWVPILDDSVEEFFGTKLPHFQGTHSSGCSVLGLSDPQNFATLLHNLARVLNEHPDTRTVLLGCAGFSGLESKFSERLPGIEFVDSVKTGFKIAAAFK